jgi:hypothetical protein
MGWSWFWQGNTVACIANTYGSRVSVKTAVRRQHPIAVLGRPPSLHTIDTSFFRCVHVYTQAPKSVPVIAGH